MTLEEFINIYEDHTSNHYLIMIYDVIEEDFICEQEYNCFQEMVESHDYDDYEIDEKSVSVHNGKTLIYVH